MDSQHSNLVQGTMGQIFPVPGKGQVTSNRVAMIDVNCLQLEALPRGKGWLPCLKRWENKHCVSKQVASKKEEKKGSCQEDNTFALEL